MSDDRTGPVNNLNAGYGIQASKYAAFLEFMFLCILFLPFFISVAPGYGETEDIEGRSLTLNECIAIGLKNNPSAEISFQNLKAVQEKTGEARGGYYPSFKFSSAYTYTTTPPDGKTAAATDSYDARFSVKQTLFDAGATSNLIKSIEHSIRSQEFEVKKTSLDITVSVKTAFNEALKKGELIEVAKISLKSAETHLRQAQALYSEGLAPRSDVIKAEVQLSNAVLDLIRAESAFLLAKANLAAAMGLPATANFTVMPLNLHEQPQLPPLTDVRAAAYNKRPELKGNRARIDSADAAVRQAKSGLYPNLSVDASYGWQESSFVPNDKKWSIGLTVGIPIFEQITAKSKVNQAIANLNGLKAVETQTVRNIELEVEQAWLTFKESIERFAVTKKTLEQALEDMRVSEGRYKEGVGNILEVIDAQTALTQAKTNYVAAQYDIANAQARLDRAAGQEIGEETTR